MLAELGKMLHAAAGLDLVSPNLYARLVGKPATGGPGVIIDPGGDPKKSVLYLKLGPNPPFGSQMPLTGPKLDDSTIECVAEWISMGAGVDASSALDSSGGMTDAD